MGVADDAIRKLSGVVDELVFGTIREHAAALVFANMAEACSCAADTAARIFAAIESGTGTEEDAERDVAELRDRLARIDAMRMVAGMQRNHEDVEMTERHVLRAVEEAFSAIEAGGIDG